MIVERVRFRQAQKVKVYPQKVNRASDVGHDCLRYLVWSRTRWQEKEPPTPELQSIFDLGNLYERYVITLLGDAGIEMIEQQRSYSLDSYQITGHIDGKIIIDGQAYPCDIKSSAGHIFNSIRNIDDLRNSAHHWLRKYPYQLNLYMGMGGYDTGFFLFVSKQTGMLKEIWMSFSQELYDETLEKAAAINILVANKETPPPIEYDEHVCKGCAFFVHCLPDIRRDALEFQESQEMIDLLNRRAELKVKADAFESIDRKIKEKIGKEPGQKVSIGDWLISTKEVTRKAYEVNASNYTTTTIKYLGSGPITGGNDE